MRTLYLVSCSKTKRSGTHPAAELYTSPLFKKSVAWVKQQMQPDDEWLILSVGYDLLHPDDFATSYDMTLSDLPSGRRELWADRVWGKLLSRLVRYDAYAGPINGTARIVFLAGWQYYSRLASRATEYMTENPSIHWRIENPLNNRTIGQRLRWLNKALKGGA